jgi:hypothetical protein
VVDATVGEQCDAGTANGMPGSCCDATCQVAAAGTVCRAPAAACQGAGVCDGAGGACPESVPLSDGTLCDDGDASTGTSACIGNVCRGVEIGVDVAAEITASNPVRIPVVLDLADGLGQSTTVEVQAFVSCNDVPALGACTPDVPEAPAAARGPVPSRGLLSRSATLPIQVQVAIREHHGGTLHAVFESLLRH